MTCAAAHISPPPTLNTPGAWTINSKECVTSSRKARTTAGRGTYWDEELRPLWQRGLSMEFMGSSLWSQSRQFRGPPLPDPNP